MSEVRVLLFTILPCYDIPQIAQIPSGHACSFDYHFHQFSFLADADVNGYRSLKSGSFLTI